MGLVSNTELENPFLMKSIPYIFALGVKYGTNYLETDLSSRCLLSMLGRQPQRLRPLLPTVINKYVQLHTRQLLSPAALKRGEKESGIRHRCIIVIHAKTSQDQVHKRLN